MNSLAQSLSLLVEEFFPFQEKLFQFLESAIDWDGSGIVEWDYSTLYYETVARFIPHPNLQKRRKSWAILRRGGNLKTPLEC